MQGLSDEGFSVAEIADIMGVPEAVIDAKLCEDELESAETYVFKPFSDDFKPFLYDKDEIIAILHKRVKKDGLPRTGLSAMRYSKLHRSIKKHFGTIKAAYIAAGLYE